MSSDSKITGASQAGTTQSSIFQQVSLKTAIVAALVAIGAIALVYAEVKYRFVSTIVSFVVANPLILGVIALVVVIGYLLYRNAKHPTPVPTNDLHVERQFETQNNTILDESDQALDANVDAWIVSTAVLGAVNSEVTMCPDVQVMMPASEEELRSQMHTGEAGRGDDYWPVLFRSRFPGRENSRATLNGARKMLNFRLRADEEILARNLDASVRTIHERQLANNRAKGAVYLRCLMNPTILNQNNITRN